MALGDDSLGVDPADDVVGAVDETGVGAAVDEGLALLADLAQQHFDGKRFACVA